MATIRPRTRVSARCSPPSAEGILAWAVRYAVAFAGGRSLHPFPKAVRVKTEDYRQGEDKLAGFIAEGVIYDRLAAVRGSHLVAAYRSWAEASEIAKWERLGQRVFLREFEERGRVKRVPTPTGGSHSVAHDSD